MSTPIDRRRFGVRMLELIALSVLAGCDRLSASPTVQRVLESAESVTHAAQSRLTPRGALAREFAEAERSRVFPTNGTTKPADPAYTAHADRGFADWRLQIGGLVEGPAALSLDDLRRL